MKLLLTALCASFMVLPAFSAECEKGKCDKEKEKKEEGTLIAEKDCDKCKKGDEKKEKEGTLIAGKDCEEGKCDKEKKKEGTLAHCGKCGKDKKDGDHKEGDDKKEKEGTMA